MKYIILAAGKGNRMKQYTRFIPKGMLLIKGIPIIQHHLNIIENINKVIIVKGYKEEKISFQGVTYYVNKKFKKTNMVYSLMLARKEFDGDIIVSYSDILYNSKILEKIKSFPGDFVVTVDINWKKYWKLRYGNLYCDTESLLINDAGDITEIGKVNPLLNKIDARYVGLLKFTKKGLQIIKDIYDSDSKWKTAYMTDLLQEIINRNYKVTAMKIENGWIEFDTMKDYEKSDEVIEKLDVL